MIETVLHGIETDSGLDRNDKWPLYRYRVNPERLEQLATELRSAFCQRRELDSHECAAFVLYSACWFCRKYSGGPWAWHTVLQPLGVHERLPDTDRVVDRGLKWWRREVAVSNGRHEYLLTLAREGGLPLSVLREGGGQNLQLYLRRLLLMRESYARSSREFATSLIAMLPKSLQRDIVVDVTSELVDVVAAIREKIPAEREDIGAWLSQFRPNWRNELPVYMENDVAEKLLRGLVEETPLASASRSADLRLVTELDFFPDLRLVRRLVYPKWMTISEFSQSLSTEGELQQLPSRLVLHLLDESGTRTPVAVATLQGDRYAFQAVLGSAELVSNIFEETRLLVTGAGRDIASVALPGGDAEADSVPWIFDRNDEQKRPRIRQRGSGTGIGDELLIALPATGGTIVQLEGSLAEIGIELSQSRRIIRLSGSACWSTADETYYFSTGAPESGREHCLNGRLLNLCGGHTAWLGAPRIRAMDDAGHQQDVPLQEIRWRPTRSRAQWSLVDERCLGDVQMRVVNRSKATIFRTRALVLPADFKMHLFPMTRQRGRIQLESRHIDSAASLAPMVTCNATPVRREVLTLDVTSQENLSQFRAHLAFVGGGEAEVWLPFPSTLRGFTDGKGELLQPKARIAINKLRFYTAVARSYNMHDAFVLEANVEGNRRVIAPLAREGLGMPTWALPLSSVTTQLEAALAGGSGVDSKIELRVVRSVGFTDPASAMEGVINLGWHDLQPEVELLDDNVNIAFRNGAFDNLTAQQKDSFRLVVQQLHSPGEVGTTLTEDFPDRWTFTPPDGRKGPWLLTGWVFTELVTRPRLLRVGPEEAEDDFQDTFESALRVDNGFERHQRIREATDHATGDLAHPSWPRIDAFLDNLAQLPPVTYDANYAVARNPRLAVLAAMRAAPGRFNTVWDGLERLGMVWPATSVRYWLDGVRVFLNWEKANRQVVDILGGGEAALKRMLPGFFDSKTARPQFFLVLLSAFWRTFANLPTMDDDYIGMARSAQGRAQCKLIFREQRSQYLSRSIGEEEGAPTGRFEEIFVTEDYPIHSEDLLASMGVSNQCPHWEGPTLAPLAAAYIMAHDVKPKRELLRELRFFRAFDEEWFDRAHAAALTVYLGELLERNNDYLDTI